MFSPKIYEVLDHIPKAKAAGELSLNVNMNADSWSVYVTAHTRLLGFIPWRSYYVRVEDHMRMKADEFEALLKATK